MKRLITILICCLSFSVFAQDERIEQLTEKLNKATTDSLRADAYIDLHNEVFKTDLAKATEYANGVLKYGMLAKSWKLVSTGYLGLARVERKKRNYATVIPYDLKALEYAKKTNVAGEAYNCTIQIARDYMDADMLTKAFTYLKQAESLAATIQRPAYIAKAKQSIGYYYYKQEKHSQAVPYFKEAINAATTANDQYILASTRMWLGHSMIQLKQYNALPEMIFSALEYFTKINSYSSMATCHELLGYCFLNNSDAKQGISNFLEARRLYEGSGNTVEQGLVCPDLARCYMLAKDYPNAKKYITEADEIFNRTKYKIGIIQLRTLWGQYYSETGQFAMADKYFQEANNLLKKEPQNDLLINNETYWAAHLYRKNDLHGGDSLTYSYTQRIAGTKEKGVIEAELNDLKNKNKGLDSISLADLKLLYTKGGADKLKKRLGNKALNRVIPFIDSMSAISPYSNASAKYDSIAGARFNVILLDKETKYRTKIKDDSLKLVTQSMQAAEQKVKLTYTILFMAVAVVILLVFIAMIQVRSRRRAEIDKEVIEDLRWELKHRVGNNFVQAVAMADRALKNDPKNANLVTLAGNIKAMASLYDLLEKNVDKQGVSMQVALTDITKILKQIYDHDDKVTIHVTSDIKLGGIPAETVARIVTELVTNSFKHAFKTSGQGTIKISLTRTDDGIYQLIVHDDGPGLPDGPAKAHGGVSRLGGIANRINGQISFSNNNGTMATLTFPSSLA